MEGQFSISQGQPLSGFLQKRITTKLYFQVVQQITEMLDKIQQQGMQAVLDLNTMQVQNGKVQFQMKAEESIYEMERVAAFLKEMTFTAVFAQDENCQCVTEFLKYLDNPGNYRSVADICNYCAGQIQPSGQLSQQSYMSQPSGQLSQQSYMAQQPIRQSPAEDETGVLGAGFWENLEEQYRTETPDAGETGVLDPSFWESALQNTPSGRLNNGNVNKRYYGRLVHVKTGAVTPITTDNFWIGKEGVDLQINKDIISRRHAVLICKSNHFFISDNDSTNKTFVNNKEIPARASVEIFNGTRIKFANEEYEFQI